MYEKSRLKILKISSILIPDEYNIHSTQLVPDRLSLDNFACLDFIDLIYSLTLNLVK